MNAFETEILTKTQNCLYLGALNQMLTPEEEKNLGVKMLSAQPEPLTKKEFRALKPAIIMSYMQQKHYPDIFRLKRNIPYDLNFLGLAEPALKYGAANCDGYAAVTMYYLLQSTIAKSLRNITVCAIGGKHRFILINCDQRTNSGIVIDPYYDFAKPLSEALKIWPEKGKIVYQATIVNIEDYLEKKDVKELLGKLENAEKSRAEGTTELENLAKRFNSVAVSVAVKAIPHSSPAFWAVQKEIALARTAPTQHIEKLRFI